jgi:hypothetical protein
MVNRPRALNHVLSYRRLTQLAKKCQSKELHSSSKFFEICARIVVDGAAHS